MTLKLKVILKGGPGSGNFGHAGRPGQRGGSGTGTGGGNNAVSVSNPPSGWTPDSLLGAHKTVNFGNRVRNLFVQEQGNKFNVEGGERTVGRFRVVKKVFDTVVDAFDSAVAYMSGDSDIL